MDFVIGHPRSGTEYLSHLLNASVDDICGHEHLAIRFPEGVSFPTEYYEGRLAKSAVRTLIEHYEGHPVSPMKIDSNWKLTWILPVLLERYPKARVVHLARDPRENIRSCYNLDYYGAKELSLTLEQEEAEILRRYWTRSMPRVRRHDWDMLSQLGRNCAFWVETHRLALDARGFGGQWLLVRLEDLNQDSKVAELTEFLQLSPISPARLATIRGQRWNDKELEKTEIQRVRGHVLPPFDQWTAPDRDLLQRMCGDISHTLGYRL